MWMIATLLPALAAGPCGLAHEGEPQTVHLVSVAPGADLFSSMGHTAVVFSGGELARPVAYDWGAYDATRPDLFPAFLSGELTYFLNRWDLQDFLRVQTLQDRTVVAQRLDLDTPTIDAMYDAVRTEALPENRTYVYHWADANCATRARDAIDAALEGSLATQLDRPVDTTPRFEATRHFWRWPVPAFAWRFITSRRLDVPLTAWDRTMVPEHLMRELDTVQGAAGPLVVERCTLHTGAYGWAPSSPPASWPWVLPGLVGALALGGAVATGRDRIVGALVLLCGAVLSAIGLGSLGVWLFGGLEGVGPTENWLLAGPQSLVLCVAGAQRLRGRRLPRWLVAATAAVGGLGLGVFVFDLFPSSQRNGDIVGALLPGLLASLGALFYGCGSAERRP